ncbi:Intraflagellar transport protein 74 [Nymphon striatum]|nr:Intraflagellar transport protein 74 [Nymphon striatum]
MSYHQSTAAGNRLSTASRPMSSRPLGTAVGPVPGTASRLISTAMQRPASKAGIGHGNSLNTKIKIADRPISQQGLATGIRTASKIPNRQIQDKSYFMGLLRTKMTEIGNEINKLHKESTLMNEEHSSYTSHEKRAEEQAKELKSLNAELAEYNILVDKLSTDTEKEDVEMEYNDLHLQNEQESKNIDQLFVEKQDKELQILKLEKETEQELHMADNLVEAMSPDLKHKYSSLKNKNVSLHYEMEEMQQTVDEYKSRKSQLEDEMSMSHMKQEAVSLYHKLREVEEKRHELLAEEQEKGTPAQEREKLLQQVKEDNQEITRIEKQISDIEEKINKMRDEITNIEQDLDEHHGERNQKYVELKKKEETMSSFLNSFEENNHQEFQRLKDKESSIVDLLERMSRNLSQFQNIPSTVDLEKMKSDLTFKEDEMEKSKSTVNMLQYELQKLSLDLQKIEALESKIGSDKQLLQEKVDTMQEDIIKFSDLESPTLKAEEKKSMLIEEKEKLENDFGGLQETLDNLEHQYKLIKKELVENETHKQLLNLERKLQHHEQNNFILKEAIANKAADSDYKRLRKSVFNQVVDYNKLLQDSLCKPSLM